MKISKEPVLVSEEFSLVFRQLKPDGKQGYSSFVLGE